MNKGKAKCEKLKKIRLAIAKANNIEYTPEECTFEGDCDGTCPKCDAELEELNRILAQKEANGEKIEMPSVVMVEHNHNESQEDLDSIEENSEDEYEDEELEETEEETERKRPIKTTGIPMDSNPHPYIPPHRRKLNIKKSVTKEHPRYYENESVLSGRLSLDIDDLPPNSHLRKIREALEKERQLEEAEEREQENKEGTKNSCENKNKKKPPRGSGTIEF